MSEGAPSSRQTRSSARAAISQPTDSHTRGSRADRAEVTNAPAPGQRKPRKPASRTAQRQRRQPRTRGGAEETGPDPPGTFASSSTSAAPRSETAGNTAVSSTTPTYSDAAGTSPEICPHLASPAYTGYPAHAICPLCRLERYVDDIRRAATIETHNGPSHRQARLELLNLEQQCSGKLAWDDAEHALNNATKKLLSTLGSRALERLGAYTADGVIGAREAVSAARSWKRGRAKEMANLPGFPGPEDFFSSKKAFRPTQEQQWFITAAGDATPEYRPPYKRRKRCVEPFDKLDFDPYVYTRKERDVDVLFSSLEKADKELPAPARGGILRSVENSAGIPASFPQPIQGRTKSPPKQPYTYSSLNTREERNTSWRTRTPRASPGCEIVNTSGWKTTGRRKMTFAEWDAYVEAMKLPATYERSRGEQLEDEVKDQRGREVQRRALRARFRPHGGMASAFAFGRMVGSRALAVAHRLF